jgi:hypothetical protein
MAIFDEIKVGDQVIIRAGGRSVRASTVAIVERVITTQFTAGGHRFTKNGHEVGGDTYWSASVELATPESIANAQAEQRYRVAQGQLRKKLNSIEALWRVIDRGHDSHEWAAMLEAALPHLQSAVEALNNRHDRHDQPSALPLPSGEVE